MKRLLVACLICLVATSALAWTKGKAHKWGATDTHGGAAGAMDTIAGVSITASDTCQVFTGTTVFNYYAWVSGDTTIASEPDIVCPDDINAGGNGITGTTLWVLADSGVSRLTVEELYIDDTIVTWDNLISGTSGDLVDKTGDATRIGNWDTAYGWGDHSTEGYLTGVTDHHALHEAGGDWELDIANLASGTSRVFDKSTDTLDQIPDGTTYKLLTATKEAYIDQDVTSGAAPTLLMNNFDWGASGVTPQSAVTAFKCWTILSPDEMASGATPVPIWTVNEPQFPRGIMLVSVSAEVTSGTTGYTIVYEEWTDSHQNDIESITCTNGAQTEVERGNIDHRVIEANRRIYLDVPSTKAYSVHGCFGYYPR